MIPLNEEDNLIEFSSLYEKIQKLKDWNLLSPKATETKTLKYKGMYTNGEKNCEVIGFISNKTKPGYFNEFCETLVIEVEGQLHKINTSYLKEMQKNNFSLYNTQAGEDAITEECK